MHFTGLHALSTFELELEIIPPSEYDPPFRFIIHAGQTECTRAILLWDPETAVESGTRGLIHILHPPRKIQRGLSPHRPATGKRPWTPLDAFSRVKRLSWHWISITHGTQRVPARVNIFSLLVNLIQPFHSLLHVFFRIAHNEQSNASVYDRHF